MTAPEPTEPKIYRGLRDVYFERSGTSLIDGRAGELSYRGYSIHDLEQQANNILIRPLTHYDGPPPRAYVPIAQRG